MSVKSIAKVSYGGKIPRQKEKKVVIDCKSIAKTLKYIQRNKKKNQKQTNKKQKKVIDCIVSFAQIRSNLMTFCTDVTKFHLKCMQPLFYAFLLRCPLPIYTISFNLRALILGVTTFGWLRLVTPTHIYSIISQGNIILDLRPSYLCPLFRNKNMA